MEQPPPAQQPTSPQAAVAPAAGAPAAAGGYYAPPVATAGPAPTTYLSPEAAAPQQQAALVQAASAPPAAGYSGAGHVSEQQAPALVQAPAPAAATPSSGTTGYAALPATAVPPTVAPPPALVGAKRPYVEAAAAAAPGAVEGYHPGMAAAYPAADGSVAKRQHMALPAMTTVTVPRETVYRLVLDVVDTALIIGRGGNTVRQIELTTGGRVKRLQEPPGAREQVVVIWNSARELPSPGRVARNAAQEALTDCVRKVVFQENAPMGQPMSVRMLISRSQEQGVLDNMNAVVAENPGISIELKRQQELPACALDNDVLVELTGERYSLMAAVEAVSHVLREHPIMERPGGAPPALRALVGTPAVAAGGYGASYGGGYRGY